MSTRPGATLLPTELAPFLEQVTGEEKGKIFELGANQLTIGRARESDIVVQSEAVSRLHARLIQSEGAWFIRDNGSKNGIFVNGKNCRESWLENGDIVQVGDFVFRFNDPSGGASAQPQNEVQPEPIAEAIPEMGVSPGFDFDKSAKPKKKPNRRFLIYGILLLLGGFWYLAKSGDPAADEKKEETPTLARDLKLPEEPNLNADPKPKKLVGQEDPILKEAEKAMLGLDWNNRSLQQAEQFFKKGQREYLSQNYHRAIEFFQTSLQLYRGHLLAERYLKRAVYEAELEAKNQMGLAVQYYTSLQYQRAMYHFNEVIVLMSHRPSEPISVEAGKYIEQCKKVLKAAELFP